jgi:hypothetical protein
MPQSPTSSQTDSVRRHFTENCQIFTGYATITDGIYPSVYFQQELFFWCAFSVCETTGNIFFPTDLATECGITDEKDVDGHFSLVI